MHDLTKHPHFEPWKDPDSGVVSFVLSERIAPLQQSFYFTSPSVSADGKWLWFYAAFPPNPQRTLGVVSLDPANPLIKHFPHAGFSAASPMLAPEGDAVYFANRRSVVKMDMNGDVSTMCTMPDEYMTKRDFCETISTHLTLSCDGKYFLLDGNRGNFWWVGIGEAETGEVTILKEFAQHYNHAMFSLTDPNLFCITQDWWNDKVSGHHFNIDKRLWVMDIQKTRFEPTTPKGWYGDTTNTAHEWWTKDGKLCWMDYQRGAFECDPYTFDQHPVWERPMCHAHCNSDRTYWCADESPYHWATRPVEILFYDRKKNRETHIVSAMPQPPVDRQWYHLDPHPHFSPCDNWVVYTTTVRGHVDVALSPVGALTA